jgi:hypothetical protein
MQTSQAGTKTHIQDKKQGKVDIIKLEKQLKEQPDII